jgi:hypothetical protein
MERNASDVARVAIEGEDCVRVGRLYVVELDGVVAGRGEIAFVGRNAKSVDL